jgi:ABC-2 type transport system permease protein
MSTVDLAPLKTVTQPRLFLWLRYRLFSNGLHVLLSRSRLRLALIFFLSAAIWGGLYAFFAEGFGYLRRMDAAELIRYWIIELLFGMFFLSLTGLMVFSTALLLYASLFRAPESGYLLTTPARPDQIFAYKLQESLLFSGWAFLLLGTPLLTAFGIEMGAQWLYYLLFMPFLLGFLLLPGAIGSLGCLLVVYLMPHRKKQALVAILILALLGVAWWAVSVIQGARIDSVSEAWLRKLLNHLKPAQLSFLPSRWMTRGLMAGARGEFSESLLHLAFLWSNALFFYTLAAWTAKHLYRRTYNRVASMGGMRKRYGRSWFDGVVAGLLRLADRRTRIFVIKDLRTFRRDPVQWAQVLVLGTILLLYFANMRWLPHSTYQLHERTLIGLLNIAVVGLMLATYTSRFIFPMMSLEGRNYWILGLLPLERDRLLLGKFTYAATLTVLTSSALALLSEIMLGLDWPIVLIHMTTIIIMALGLSAISVGLGAYLVNLKESNPAKIATGFGGTINLLVSLLFAVTAILLAGVPTFLYFADTTLREEETVALERIRVWLLLGGTGLLLVGAATVYIPLRMGIRAFRRMEF